MPSSPPLNVSATSTSSSIRLQWTAPASRNGKITAYHVLLINEGIVATYDVLGEAYHLQIEGVFFF